MFLLSQPDLEHSGVIGLRLERWADDLAGTEPEDIRRALEELAEHRFVVLDWRKQEALVRSLIRRDDVWRQPNVFKAAAASIRAVRSQVIKAALLAELQRLNLADDKHKDVRTLRDELVDDLAEPTGKGSANPSAKGSGDPSLRGQGKGSTGSTTASAPSPATSPSPRSPSIPPPAGAATRRAATPETLPGAPDKPESEGQRANRLTQTFVDQRPLSNFKAAAAIVTKAIRANHSDDAITAALKAIAADNDLSLTAETLRKQLEGSHGNGHTTYRNPPDQSVYETEELKPR